MEWTEAIAAITGDADRWAFPLSEACTRWEINTSERVNAFLATCGHESAGFTRLVEDMRYSAARLIEVWPNRFTPELAASMAGDERRVAEHVYGGRMGNDAEGAGDGYLYRARGFGITGRNAYRAANVVGPDFEQDPDLVAEPKWAAHTFAEFWKRNGLNELADAGKFQSIVLRVNGGTVGMPSRLAWLDKVRGALA